ncbi:MAG: hypothetical protein AAFQ94_18520 [Bacteroidota bacterium]
MKTNQLSRFAIYTAQFFRSLDIVIIFLVCFIIFQTFETQTLFYSTLNKVENQHVRLAASILAAVVFDVTQLIFTFNKDKFFAHISFLIAGFSLIINLLFFEVWIGEWDEIVKKLVVSLLFTSLSFLYTELFVKKWLGIKRLLHLENHKQNLKEIQQKAATLSKQAKSKQQQLDNIKRAIDLQNKDFSENKKLQQELSKKIDHQKNESEQLAKYSKDQQEMITDQQSELQLLENRKKEVEAYIEKCTCPYCQTILPTPKAKSGHMAHCKFKPTD